MRTINKQAARVLNTLALLAEKNEGHVKIDNTNGAFMPVHVEILNPIDLAGRSARLISVAHYYEQNGDLVPDPEMEFAQSTIDPDYVWPVSFTSSYGTKYGLYQNNSGKWMMNPWEQKDEAIFAGMWMKNIKHQQRLNLKN